MATAYAPGPYPMPHGQYATPAVGPQQRSPKPAMSRQDRRLAIIFGALAVLGFGTCGVYVLVLVLGNHGSSTPNGSAQGVDQRRLDDMVPPTVTMEWCGRLRRRLQDRLTSDVRAKYGSDRTREEIAQDHALAQEQFCHEAIGQPTAGLWMCRWNETLYNYKACDAMDQSDGSSH